MLLGIMCLSVCLSTIGYVFDFCQVNIFRKCKRCDFKNANISDKIRLKTGTFNCYQKQQHDFCDTYIYPIYHIS